MLSDRTCGQNLLSREDQDELLEAFTACYNEIMFLYFPIYL